MSISYDHPHDISVDPWRPQTPHSDDAPDREDTVLRPFKIIPGECVFFFSQCAGTDVFLNLKMPFIITMNGDC